MRLYLFHAVHRTEKPFVPVVTDECLVFATAKAGDARKQLEQYRSEAHYTPTGQSIHVRYHTMTVWNVEDQLAEEIISTYEEATNRCVYDEPAPAGVDQVLAAPFADHTMVDV